MALAAAGVSINIDRFASAFFQRGAIPATILQVENGYDPAQQQRLENWWKKLLQGVKRAWETIAVPMSIKPIVVGSPIKDLAVPELENQVREKICASLGVAESIAGQAANYAVSKEDYLSFYRDTIIPEAGVIEPALNEQVFNPQGIQLTFNPEELDIMQEDETSRAQAFAQYVTGGLPATWAAEMLGLEAPEGHTWEELDRQQKEAERQKAEAQAAQLEKMRQAQQPGAQQQPVAASTGGNGHQPGEPMPVAEGAQPSAPKALLDDLRRWREKARNRGADKAFESDVIPTGIKALVRERLLHEPERAFAFLKTIDETRLSAEEAMAAAASEELARWLKATAAAIQNGQAFDEAGFVAGMQNALDDVLAGLVTEQALREAATIGIDFDIAVINHEAWTFARSYSYELVKGLGETTRKVVQDAIAKFVATPGMTNKDLTDLLMPAFGPVRSEKIGITEVTRAFSAGTDIYQQHLLAMGLDFEKVWNTSSDEKVCIRCGPLNGKPESEWPDYARGGPPIHTGDRCWEALRLRRRKAAAA